MLILGRFTAERKTVLDAIKVELCKQDFVPILFDFEQPANRDFTETIMTLAKMCRFIIADITNPKSSPLELQATVPDYMIPFVPSIEEGEKPFSMFKDLKGKFNWVLDLLVYNSESDLVRVFEEALIKPALKKHDELMAKKLKNCGSGILKIIYQTAGSTRLPSGDGVKSGAIEWGSTPPKSPVISLGIPRYSA